MNRPKNIGPTLSLRRWRRGLAIAAFLCTIGCMAAPLAFADDHGHGRHDDQAHHRDDQHRGYEHHDGYGYDHRGYGGRYPPPIVYGPPVGIQLVIPLY